MAKTALKKLRYKARKFVIDVADGENPTKAALKHYEIKGKNPQNIAAAIANENFTKPNIQQALNELGFNVESADKVVSTIMNNEAIEPQARLKAADMVYKRIGSYAVEKSLNISVQGSIEELRTTMQERIKRLKEQQ